MSFASQVFEKVFEKLFEEVFEVFEVFEVLFVLFVLELSKFYTSKYNFFSFAGKCAEPRSCTHKSEVAV